MKYKAITRVVLHLFAAASAIMSVGVGYISVVGPSTFPQGKELTTAAGTLSSAQPGRYGITFTYGGDTRVFFYARKSGDIESVTAFIRNPANQPITTLFVPKPQQGSEIGPFFQVYQISSHGVVFRSREQVRRAWEIDYRYGLAGALFLFIIAVYLEYEVRRT